MTITQCKYVLAIARFGSMNEAAKHLLVSQASLSAAVRELEIEFGIRIFDRSNKGVRVTKEGAEFVRYARQLIAQVEVITDRYHGEEKKSVRNFAVTAQHYDFVAEAFISFLGTVKEEYSFALKEARTAQVIEDVLTLRSDLGVLCYQKEEENSYMERYLRRNGLATLPFLETKPHIFLGKDHPLAARTVLRLDDLSAYPYVTYDQGDTGPVDFAEEMAENRMPGKQIRISDRATLMNLLLTNDAYTVGTGIMTSELNRGSVVSIPLDSDDVYVLALIYRADTGFSEDAIRFIEFLGKVTGSVIDI